MVTLHVRAGPLAGRSLMRGCALGVLALGLVACGGGGGGGVSTLPPPTPAPTPAPAPLPPPTPTPAPSSFATAEYRRVKTHRNEIGQIGPDR